ncbi:helix-turn-helix domain-containing protein [Xanthobacter sediminis]
MSEQQPHLLSPDEAARYLGISKSTFLAHVRHGDIAFISVGRGTKNKRRKFLIADLDEFIAQRREREAPMLHSTQQPAIPVSKMSILGFTALREARQAEKARNAQQKKNAAKTRKS